jgi:hypothetical protein
METEQSSTALEELRQTLEDIEALETGIIEKLGKRPKTVCAPSATVAASLRRAVPPHAAMHQ